MTPQRSMRLHMVILIVFGALTITVPFTFLASSVPYLSLVSNLAIVYSAAGAYEAARSARDTPTTEDIAHKIIEMTNVDAA